MADEFAFDWDVGNTAHIARHRVTSDEVEQVFANDPIGIRAEVIGGEERYTSVGHTNRLRVLVVGWTMNGETIRPITAFNASRKLVGRDLAGRGF